MGWSCVLATNKALCRTVHSPQLWQEILDMCLKTGHMIDEVWEDNNPDEREEVHMGSRVEREISLDLRG